MSEKFIPEQIDPYRAAEQNTRIHGIVKVSDLTRLPALVMQPEQTVIEADMQFSKDEQQEVTRLEGNLKSVLQLQCQRCLELYKYEIMTDFVLGIVKTLEAANTLPAPYEPAVVKEDSLALRELLEDEILLNLPIIPRHEEIECLAKLPSGEALPTKRDNPFQVLASLKDNKTN